MSRRTTFILRLTPLAAALALGSIQPSVSAVHSPLQPASSPPRIQALKGAHIIIGSESDLELLGKNIPNLEATGLNTVVLEIDYNYCYTSRPEMAKKDGVTFEGARQFAKICKSNHVHVIPQINCLGHQSWAESTDTLLRVHPELDETPGLYPGNKGIYCRSWCPLNPDVPKIVFPLIDELISAFKADSFHVGMDEVFILGAESCPRCHGKDHAELFAAQVNALHSHLASKHIHMFMWADRFLDGKATGYGEWEASENGTDKAIDLVPKDIVMCDWHYDKRSDYPSLKYFADHGFKVWPTTWRDVDAAQAFSDQAKSMNDSHVVGVLSSNWGSVSSDKLAAWPPYLASLLPWK